MTEKRNMLAIVTPDIAEEVIQSLYSGLTVAQYHALNKEKPNFPALSSIYRFFMADNAIKSAYIQAREACADALADQVIIEADSNSIDPARASNRMKGRQWLAAKIKPKVYGDKLDLEVTGRIDVSTAILEARKRASLLSDDTKPMLDITPVDPFS